MAQQPQCIRISHALTQYDAASVVAKLDQPPVVLELVQ